MVKRIWLLAIACSAAPHVAPPPPHEMCVPLVAPSARAVYGRVTDASRKPLAGVVVEEADGSSEAHAAAQARTSADGAYVLPTVHGTDLIIMFELDGRRVVWAHLDAPRRIDVVLDRGRPAGILAVHDGLIERADPCAPWICPPDRAPIDLWWTHDHPCPDGAQLQFSLAAGVTIECELDGKPHGASTNWLLTSEHRSIEHVGWYDHGQRCGQWRETPAVASPGDHP
jgi:hypothetical protein